MRDKPSALGQRRDDAGSAGRTMTDNSGASMAVNRRDDQWLRDRAYYIWEREGRPHGRALNHWLQAIGEAARVRRAQDHDPTPDEERILSGRIDVNLPALLTKDVPGG